MRSGQSKADTSGGQLHSSPDFGMDSLNLDWLNSLTGA